MVAYKKWGDEEAVRAHPIAELLKLYVHFHEEAKTQPELEDEGRAWFKKLEDGNEEATELWTWFREESLKEFQKVYDLLGVEFESFNGEAFYNDKMDRIVAMLEEKNLLVESEGAMVVSLEDENLPPCLIKKKDGATLYATRDLAAASIAMRRTISSKRTTSSAASRHFTLSNCSQSSVNSATTSSMACTTCRSA